MTLFCPVFRAIELTRNRTARVETCWPSPESRRIKVPPTLPEAAPLVRELTTFQLKIAPAANEVFGAWREGQYDDLVLADAIGIWQAEHFLEAWVL
jgi:hypothetical protein